eukprot:3482833-Rhodomonas_salina.1
MRDFETRIEDLRQREGASEPEGARERWSEWERGKEEAGEEEEGGFEVCVSQLSRLHGQEGGREAASRRPRPGRRWW